MHCINLEYTGEYCSLISAPDKFCYLKSLWTNEIWYVSSKWFFLTSFTWQYCGTHTYHIYATIHLC